MYQLICNNNKIIYNAYHLLKAFYPEEELTSEMDERQDVPIKVKETSEPSLLLADDVRELYQNLRERTKRELPWGMLTGVRPTKLATKWIQENEQNIQSEENDREEAFAQWFYQDRFVSREKAGIAYQVARKEKAILDNILKNGEDEAGYSLYIGIPFCPTVCSYCSFSSGAISQYEDRVDVYLDALCRELERTAAEYGPSGRQKKWPSTVYIGGGTPTALSEIQLERLLTKADMLFQIRTGIASGKIREFTVEAGRPDSINREKLELIRKFGVTRISINPQSMQQKTLDRIGRRHTVLQVREAFYLAREMGFDNINMDLIMGLSGESNTDVKDTLRQIRELDPDSLTVHSLAVKRSSAIGIAKKTGQQESSAVYTESSGNAQKNSCDIAQMIQDAYDTAIQMGMAPYYLYRQKSIAGNFENIGYAKAGKEGLYNILIMEEVQSIIACGAGASTKIVTKEAVPNPKRKGQASHMIRSENVKNIEEYIKRNTSENEKPV